jgi:ankyrin repeat protein
MTRVRDCPDHLAKILGNTEPPKYRDDITCFTPLHFACMTGDEKVVVALLQAGADPNLRTFVYVNTTEYRF